MGTFPRHSGLFIFAAIATTAVVLLGFLGWPQPGLALEFSGLIVAAILTSVLAVQRPVAGDRGMMPLAFIIHFASLLLFGPLVTMIVVTAGTAAYMLGDPLWTRPPERSLMNAATTIAALHVAGVVHVVLGGTPGHFVWPWQGVPIALAAATYALAHTALAEIVVPLITGQPINRSWAGTVLRDCPHHLIGAGLAVGLLEIIDHRTLGSVAGRRAPAVLRIPHVRRPRAPDRRRAAPQESSNCWTNVRGDQWPQGHALERCARTHAGLPRAQALGRPLIEALPALPHSGLGERSTRRSRMRVRVTLIYGLLSASGARILQVTIRPGDGGATLLWHDVTERTRAEQALKRSEERLALAAEGANDGCGSGTCARRSSTSRRAGARCSACQRTAGVGRSRGMDSTACTRRRSAALKEALEAHLSGPTDTSSTSIGSVTRTAPTGGSCAAASRCAAPASAPFASPGR